ADAVHEGRIQLLIGIYRRISGRHQQFISFAQRHVEGLTPAGLEAVLILLVVPIMSTNPPFGFVASRPLAGLGVPWIKIAFLDPRHYCATDGGAAQRDQPKAIGPTAPTQRCTLVL